MDNLFNEGATLTNKQPKKSNQNRKLPERIPLEKQSSEILGKHIVFLEGKYPGVKIKKHQLLNWLVVNHCQTLTAGMESGLYNEYYDEERVLLEALKEVKRLKKEGKSINLEQVLQTKKKTKKRVRKPKSKRELNAIEKVTSKQEGSSTIESTSIINLSEKGA